MPQASMGKTLRKLRNSQTKRIPRDQNVKKYLKEFYKGINEIQSAARIQIVLVKIHTNISNSKVQWFHDREC